MGRNRLLPAFAVVALLISLGAPAGHAGIMDAVKQKVKDKATKKATDAADKATGSEKAATGGDKAAASGEQKAAPAAGAESGKVSAVSTKFDFVPGDSVLFFDDFTQDDLGEFPQRWKLVGGTFEVAEMDGHRWLRCVSTSGDIRMKVPPSLPELWTLEFDFYGVDMGGAIALTVTGLSKSGSDVWAMLFPVSGQYVSLRCGEITSNTSLDVSAVPGRHHVMLMARGTALKVYLDRERMANVPDVTAPGTPVEFNFNLGAPSKPMITNVRFAEGPRPPKDMLAGGKLVTHGILFESGSDVVLPESAPVLRQIAAYMESNADSKLKIIGHTDNVGSAASNLDLSKRRAASVANVLSTQFKIGADRFQTDGKGDTQPVSSNAKPEGRAMNRRVEFTKL